MKKTLTALLFLMTLPFPLLSCHSTVEKVPVFQSSVVSRTETDSTYYLSCRLFETDLTDLMAKKASFPLVVYAPGCGTCSLFDYALWDYEKTYQAALPYAMLSNYASVSGLPEITDNSLVIFNGGKVVKTITITAKNQDSKSFFALMDTYTYRTDILIDNWAYINPIGLTNYLKFYTYQKIITCDTNGKDASLFSSNLYNDLSKKEAKRILFINWDTLTDASDLSKAFGKGLDYQALYVYDSTAEATFEATTGFTKDSAKTYTSWDYSPSKGLSIQTSDSITDLN
ncbi:MAG: hypothetical protein LKM30_07975 [Bacilli bacterium]|jgi:hypothetical protein|nr:hypothetical protein [Bacilli bacterium]